MDPHIDARPASRGQQRDEWGALWNNIGISRLGEIIEYPLANWDNFATYRFPDILDSKRWEHLQQRPVNVDTTSSSASAAWRLRTHIHFLDLENTWTDIYLEPDNLHRLLDKLVEMNLEAMPRFPGALGADGFAFCDDWGLPKNKLMISPDKWMEFWFDAYRRVYQAAHRHGMTLLHS